VYRYIAREIRTPHERPLSFKDVKKIRDTFPDCSIEYCWLFSLGIFLYFFFIERANPTKERYWKKVLYEADRYKDLFTFLKKLDDVVLPMLPFLGPLCWNMVICIKKRG
jgi:hypothetical protein